MNGPSVHYIDVSIPIAEDTQRVRLLADAFKVLGSAAFRVAGECEPALWPFKIDFDGAFTSLGTRFDVTVNVTITAREETPDDTTGPAASLPLGN